MRITHLCRKATTWMRTYRWPVAGSSSRMWWRRRWTFFSCTGPLTGHQLSHEKKQHGWSILWLSSGNNINNGILWVYYGIFIWSYFDPICMCTPCLRMVQNSKIQEICLIRLDPGPRSPKIHVPAGWAYFATHCCLLSARHFMHRTRKGLGVPCHIQSFLRVWTDWTWDPIPLLLPSEMQSFFFCWLQHRFCDRILPRFCCRNTIAVGATFRLPDLFSTNQSLTCHRRQRQSFGHPTTEFRSCFVHGEALLQVPWCKGAGLLHKG